MAAPASLPSGRSASVAVIAVTLAVFALVVADVTWRLRAGLHEQVLQREAATLTEVASMQLANEADTLAALGIANAPGELLNAVLKTSKLRGVFAVRIFDAAKRFGGAVPLPWSERPPPEPEWQELRQGHPIARLRGRESITDVIGFAPETPTALAAEPVLQIWLPLRRADNAPFSGAAEMWLDGHAIAREFARLDRRLVTQAVSAWLAGSFIISVSLLWAFRRLAAANRQLELRTEDLLRANRELELAAKTSALGAVAAHLMHELKNPVAGLEEFVASQAEAASRSGNGAELAAASDLTRRLRRMINDVVGVMRDEQGGAHFELTGDEIVGLAVAKTEPLARERGVALATDLACGKSIGGRRANLAILVLANLLQNAVEAAPRGTTVTLQAGMDQDVVLFSVADRGPGLSDAVRERLFQPVASGKPGGSGLGLALSQQLARQAGGRIELVRSGASGTCFRLVLDARET